MSRTLAHGYYFLRPIARRPSVRSHIVSVYAFEAPGMRALCGVGINPTSWKASMTTERRVCPTCWQRRPEGTRS